MTVARHAAPVVARQAFRQVRRAAIAWGFAFGATAAASATTYVDSFPTQASRAQIAASTSRDVGLRVLLGPTSEIGTVGGYTVYKGFVFLTSIAAVWALLVTTRLLRGEEDAGRWHLVLAGAVQARAATRATLVALLGAVTVVTAGTAALLAIAGRDPDVGFDAGDTIIYAASLGLVAATFVGIGAVTSQLANNRRSANVMGASVFGLAFGLRMVADADTSTEWLRWLTPFGWSELVAPLTSPRWTPVVVATVATLLLCGVAVTLSGRRDVGHGLLDRRRHSHRRTRGLTSATAFALRTERSVIVAWWVGIAASGLLLGFVAQLTQEAIPESMRGMLDRFGVAGTFTRQYFGVAFLLVAALLALLPATQVGAAADEELSGRLVHLMSRGPSRITWLAGRLLVAAVAVLVAAVLAGAGAWAAASARGVGIGLPTVLGATLNAVPTALVVLALGALVAAVIPRAAGPAVYVVVIWSLLVDLVAPLVTGARWLEHLSVFDSMALAPAEPVHATTIVVTLLVAAALMGVALALFARRDLKTG